MYTIYVTFDCYPGKREAFVKRVREEGILDAVLAEDGCYRYDYFFSEKDPNLLLLLEAWESYEHQQIHIAQPHMEKLRSFNKDYIKSANLGEYVTK